MSVDSKRFPTLARMNSVELQKFFSENDIPKYSFNLKKHYLPLIGTGFLFLSVFWAEPRCRPYLAVGGSVASIVAFNVSIISDRNSQRLEFLEQEFKTQQAEKIAVLKTLLWLSYTDGQLSKEEKEVINSLANAMKISNFDPIKESKNLTNDLNSILKFIKRQEAKEFLVKQIIHLCYCDGFYDAIERKALVNIAKGLGESSNFIEKLEVNYAQEILDSHTTSTSQNNDLDEAAKKHKTSKGWDWGRVAYISGLTMAGGAVVAASGGIAAPAIGGLIGSQFMGLSGAAAISAGLAAIGGGSLATGGLGMAGGSAIITSVFGLGGAVAGASSGWNLKGELDEFTITSVVTDRRACHSLICIHGFLQEKSEPEEEWHDVADFFQNSFVFGLNWESKKLEDIHKILTDGATRLAITKIAGYSAKSGLKAAGSMFAWPASVLSAFKLIDNPWSVARNRAEKAGVALGKVIQEMKSPISLLGYSLGSRVIIHALQYLQENEVYGKVYDVYLLGGAVGYNSRLFKQDNLKKVVTNCVFNVYSERDAVLRYLYRTAEWGDQPIGLRALSYPGIIDVDVTESVGGHLDYPRKLKTILTDCNRHA